MKKFTLSLLVIGFSFIYSSCEELSDLGCTDEEAVNFDPQADEDAGNCTYYADLITDTWYGDSLTYEINISDELIQLAMVYAESMSDEEFEEEFGIPKPTTEEQWLTLAEQIPNEAVNLEGTSYTFNETTIDYYDGEETYFVEYYFDSQNSITILDTLNQLGYAHLDIETINDTELILSNNNYLYQGIIPATVQIYLYK